MDDATKEARIAEINIELRKRGDGEVRGADRTAMVHELGTLLGAGDRQEAALTPEKRARADEIGRRLRDHAADKPDAHLDVFERRRLAEELADLTLGAGEAPPAAGGGSSDGGDGQAQ